MAASIASSAVKTIYVACEAGMGSSLMCVNDLKKKLKAAKVQVDVVHKPARAVPKDAQLVLVHKSLGQVVRKQVPDAVVVTFGFFLNDPVFAQVVKAFAEGREIAGSV